jgi:hypothetical protein
MKKLLSLIEKYPVIAMVNIILISRIHNFLEFSLPDLKWINVITQNKIVNTF